MKHKPFLDSPTRGGKTIVICFSILREMNKKQVYHNFIDTFKRGVIPVLLIYILVSIIVGYIQYAFNISMVSNTLFQVLVVSIQFIFFGLFTLSYIKLTDRSSTIYTEKINYKMILIAVLVSIILFLIQTGAGIISQIAGLEPSQNSVLDSDRSPIYFLYMIPVMIFLVGPSEELLFRGVLQGSFTDNFSVRYSIGFTSIIFSIIHLPAIGGISISAIPYLVTVFILSVILGYTYEYTNNIIIPSLAHGIYNSYLLIISYYIAQSGVM